MGASIGKTFRKMVGQQNMRILMVGLDGAGKTTILYQMKIGEVVSTVPTVGFNVENVQYKNINFNVWDVGGQDKMRPLWHAYYKDVRGVIYVVDSSDLDRLDEAREELDHLMSQQELRGVPLLVLANKKDLPYALATNDLSQRLCMDSLARRKWFIQSTCATTGDGIVLGLDWLSHVLAGTVRERKE